MIRTVNELIIEITRGPSRERAEQIATEFIAMGRAAEIHTQRADKEWETRSKLAAMPWEEVKAFLAHRPLPRNPASSVGAETAA